MNRICLFALLIVLGNSSPAIAGKNDDIWAKCLWSKVPTSANAWIDMPLPPRWQAPGEIQPEFALQNRLQAACRDVLLPAGKKSAPSFNNKGVRAALLASKPADVGPDVIDPKAYVCRRYFLDDKDLKAPAAFRWGYGADMSQAQFGTMSLIFAAKGGGGVGLPETGGLEKCSWIQADGSLAHA